MSIAAEARSGANRPSIDIRHSRASITVAAQRPGSPRVWLSSASRYSTHPQEVQPSGLLGDAEQLTRPAFASPRRPATPPAPTETARHVIGEQPLPYLGTTGKLGRDGFRSPERTTLRKLVHHDPLNSGG